MTRAGLTAYWPGLANAWQRGAWRSLGVAVCFAWCLCLLLLATFVWQAWWSQWTLRVAWTVVGACWLVAAVRGRLAPGNTAAAASVTRFQAAQQEYLKGNWFEAEAQLLALVQEHPRDAEAWLLLAGVLRRSKRWEAALRRLNQLQMLDGALAWTFEISRERALVETELRALADAASDRRSGDIPNDMPATSLENGSDEEAPVPDLTGSTPRLDSPRLDG